MTSSATESTVQTIHSLIRCRAERTPHAVAVAEPGRPDLSYARLAGRLAAIVGELNAFGIGRNDRVAVVLPNGAEMAVATLGVMAGATCAPLNPGYSVAEFEFYLSDLKACAVLTRSGTSEAVEAAAASLDLPVIKSSVERDHPVGVFSLLADRDVGSRARSGFAEPDDLALLLHTAGTTSRPKIVPLAHRNIAASVENIRRALELTAADRSLNVMPLFHLHGLGAAVMASLVAGAAVICTAGFYAKEFFDVLTATASTWYTAAPAIHQAILAHAAAQGRHVVPSSLRLVRSAAAALPTKTLMGLEKLFRVPVIESYGVTEASSQVASNPLPPGVRKPGSVGVAAGPQIAIVGESGQLLRAGEVGEIAVRGVTVIPGYENDPAANAAAFVDGWFRTGDQGFLDDDGYLFITGRLKELINRGGEKIGAREIEDVLMDHPAVVEAAAFAIPDARLGEEVGAVVVLRDTPSTTPEDLRNFAATRLAAFKVPRRIVIASEIPKSEVGKVQRSRLAAALGLSTAEPRTVGAARPQVGPRTAVERIVAAIWSDVLGVGSIGIDDDFVALGGDSMSATLIASRIHDAVGIEMSPGRLFEMPTVAALASFVTKSRRRIPRRASRAPRKVRARSGPRSDRRRR